MNRKLRVLILAVLALALFASSAFALAVEPGAMLGAVTITWTGASMDNDWDNPHNWNPFGVPGMTYDPATGQPTGAVRANDVAFFSGDVSVTVDETTPHFRGIYVDKGVSVTINVKATKALRIGEGSNSFIGVGRQGSLTLTDQGRLELMQSTLCPDQQDVSFVLASGDSGVRTRLKVDVEVKQPSNTAGPVTKNTFFRVEDWAELTFTQPINNGEGDAWKIPVGDVAMIFGAQLAAQYPQYPTVNPAGLLTNSILCVNYASQIKAIPGDGNGSRPFVIAPMQGRLKVVKDISVTGGHTGFQTLLSSHPSDTAGGRPVFEVTDGATFTITAGPIATEPFATSAPWFTNPAIGSNDVDFALAVDPHTGGGSMLGSSKFAKDGEGEFRLIGGTDFTDKDYLGDWKGAISETTFPTRAAAVDDEVKYIDVLAGTLAMEKGGRPAWEPSSDGTKLTTATPTTATENKVIYVKSGATFWAVNTEAVRPNNGFITHTGESIADPEYLLKNMRFDNEGTVRIGAYGAIANLLTSLPFLANATGITGERYPDQEAKTASVYLLPRASVHMMADEALLEVFGDQAFKRVWGGEYPSVANANKKYGGLVSMDKGADLILTEMDAYEFDHESNVDGHRFYGNVGGAGGVAFAKAYELKPGGKTEDNKDITTQYFPFRGLFRNEKGYIVRTRNDYGDDTIVYGRSRLVVDQDSILPKPSGESFSPKGAMYLRSDQPHSVAGDVGSLRARKTTVKGHYPDTVYIDHLKVDAASAQTSRAWVDVSAADYRGMPPYKQADPYVPLSQEDTLMREYGLRLLAVKDVTYNVNKALVKGAFKDVYSFQKTGDSTLLLLEKGRGALKADVAADDSVVVQRGRLWLRGEKELTADDLENGVHYALSECSVTVNPSNQIINPVPKWTAKTMDTEDIIATRDQWTGLHVTNGLDIKNDLYYRDKATLPYYGLFVTELLEENRDYSGLDPEGNPLQGRRAAVNVADQVRGEGIDFQGSILQAKLNPEKGAFMIFEADEPIYKGVLKGFLGKKEADTGYLTVYTNDRLGKGPVGFNLGETRQGLLGVAMLQDITDSRVPAQTTRATFTIPMESNVDVEPEMVKVEALTGLLGDLVATLSGAQPNYTITVTANVNAAQGTSLTYYPKELLQVSVYVDEDAPRDPVDRLNGQRVYPITLAMFNPEKPDEPIGPEPTPPTTPESLSPTKMLSPIEVDYDDDSDVVFTIGDTTYPAKYDEATDTLTLIDADGNEVTIVGPKAYLNKNAITGATFEDNGDGTVTVTVPGSALVPGTNDITVGDIAKLLTKPVTVTKKDKPVDPTKPFAITTTSLPAATVGVAYEAFLEYDFNPPIVGATVTWTVTGLPKGLECDEHGLISGTPEEDGAFPISITAETPASGGHSDSVSLTLTVNKSGEEHHHKSSGGGCDAGFGGLALALAAAFLLKRKA